MKKQRRRSPSLPDALKESPDEGFVTSAARRAFVAFLRGILRDDDKEPRRTG